MDDKWRRKVDALMRLAKDQKGKPEGDVAHAKLQAILDKYPEASARYEPFRDFIFTTQDFVRAKRAGINMMGKWSGGTLHEAIATMVGVLAMRAKGTGRAFNTMDPFIRDLARMAEGEEQSIPVYDKSFLQDQMDQFIRNRGVEEEDEVCDGTCEEPDV